MPNPTTNAEGLPTMPLSEEQRFVFDTRGWLLLPALLTDERLDSFALRIQNSDCDYAWWSAQGQLLDGAFEPDLDAANADRINVSFSSRTAPHSETGPLQWQSFRLA